MGLLPSRKYSTLESVKSKQSLKTHAPLWRIWIAILLSLTIYLLSLRKIMAIPLISPSSLSPGFPVIEWMISVLALLVMVVCLDPCTRVVLVYFWCLKNSGNSDLPLFTSDDLQQCELGSRYERKELKLGGCENNMTMIREVKTPITTQLNKGHITGNAPCMRETLNVHYPEHLEKEDTKTVEAEKPTKMSKENIASTSLIMENEENQPQQLEEDMEEYEEEQFDYEFEDLIVDEPLKMDEPINPLPIFPNDEISPILISEDPPFSKKDLEDSMRR